MGGSGRDVMTNRTAAGRLVNLWRSSASSEPPEAVASGDSASSRPSISTTCKHGMRVTVRYHGGCQTSVSCTYHVEIRRGLELRIASTIRRGKLGRYRHGYATYPCPPQRRLRINQSSILHKRAAGERIVHERVHRPPTKRAGRVPSSSAWLSGCSSSASNASSADRNACLGSKPAYSGRSAGTFFASWNAREASRRGTLRRPRDTMVSNK